MTVQISQELSVSIILLVSSVPTPMSIPPYPSLWSVRYKLKLLEIISLFKIEGVSHVLHLTIMSGENYQVLPKKIPFYLWHSGG